MSEHLNNLVPRHSADVLALPRRAVACTPASGWEKGQVENQVGQVSVSPKQSIFAAIDWIADHCEPCSPSWSLTIARHACALQAKKGLFASSWLHPFRS